MKRAAKLLFIFTVMIAYQEMSIRWSWGPPDPPVEGTPIGNHLMHLTTVAGVFSYGVWKFWKK